MEIVVPGEGHADSQLKDPSITGKFEKTLFGQPLQSSKSGTKNGLTPALASGALKPDCQSAFEMEPPSYVLTNGRPFTV